MAKSSKKQCRKPRPPKQGGGLVVVSAHDMRKIQGNKRTESVMERGKGRMKTPKGVTGRSNGSSMTETREDFHPFKGSTTSGGKRGFLFISTTMRPERLYYLLHVQPLPSVSKEERSSAQREKECHALVFVATIPAAQELLAQLKALSVSAFAVHERTPKAQAEDYVRRVFSGNSQERAAVLIITNGAVGRPISLGGVRATRARTLRVVHFDAASNAKIRAARERAAKVVRGGRDPGLVDEIFLEDDHTERLEPFPFNGPAMDAIRSRLAVARKLVRAQSAASCSRGQDEEMKRRASAAGLDWDDDSPEEIGADGAVTSEKKRGLAQQAVALKEKLRVLLCQPLLPLATPPPAGGEGDSSTPGPRRKTSSKETRKKMTVLGMIPPSPEARPDERCRAQSRWLDEALARKFGGDWEGSVRVGASCDSASRALRSLVETAKQAKACQTELAGSKGSKRRVMTAMRRWDPKPDTPDDDRWGGKWGKPCGHNEVVLQHLRPFAPIEVMNTRVCSKASPAPGNSGFEGCMEYLSRSCWAHRRALTIWDDAAFHFIDPSGKSSRLDKQDMLQLPLPMLRFVMKNMKSFTIFCDGQRPPRELARSVLYCAGWAAKQSCFAPLDKALSARVMSFVLSGDRTKWRSISRVADGVSSQASAAATADAVDDVRLIFSVKKRRFNL